MRHLGYLSLRENRLEWLGSFPGPAVSSHSCTSALGELFLRCPGEFFSGGLYVQAPVQFHQLWRDPVVR